MNLVVKTTVAEIAREFQASGILVELSLPSETSQSGSKDARPLDQDLTITGISAVETSGPGDLVFMDKETYLPLVRDRRPTAVVTTPALAAKVKELKVAVLSAKNVALAHAKIKGRYLRRDFTLTGWSGIHPTAVVHLTAQLEPGVQIEPRAVVGANAKIGRGSRVMAGAVIENDVEIGSESIIHPTAVIGYGCKIGDHVDVGSGTVIGSEGYGYAQDQERKSHAIPQTGIVVIEDRVRIGSNCSIDRATYQETRIGTGSKIDNLCHIAHNVTIGEDCLLTAMLCVAGSTQIGNRVITSGQTGILDHMKIADDVVLLHRAGVNRDIDRAGAYAGVPPLPVSEYLKNLAVLKSAADLRKRLARLESILGAQSPDLAENKVSQSEP